MRIVSSQPNKPAETGRADAPARMRPLAVLPVFFSLQGKRAVVIGGSEAAAWKAELLASAGADVVVFAETADTEMDELVRRGCEAGSLTLLPRVYQVCDLEGAALVIADAEDKTEAAGIVEAARAAGVPVNVIDKPAYCDFQFGSIVNRSPLVVGISTDGAAPILGQAVRRRIETLLPAMLGAWAALARQVRQRVGEALKPGAERRRFWEGFVDRAFARAPAAGEADELLGEAGAIARSSAPAGRVTLVGAGPGDAELLTMKAVRALQSADVILFDDLVSDDVLELARREARRMLVGKRGGRVSCRQEDINATMVALARAGKNVVRLKSGDPMVFGRAGEEIAELRGQGIAVSVVPGITAALAMASALGVSLTHRDLAQSVRFVTGHSRNGGLPQDVDWRAVADPRATAVFYMGGRTAAELAVRLMTEGLAGATPVVVASALTRANEVLWTGRLSQLADAVSRIGYDEPVLIGVGTVFAAARTGTGAGRNMAGHDAARRAQS